MRRDRRTKYPYISRAADMLGINRVHLFKILEGRRPDPNKWAPRYYAIRDTLNEAVRKAGQTAATH